MPAEPATLCFRVPHSERPFARGRPGRKALGYRKRMVETADPRARERVGAVLDEKWTLERLLGIGGMGAVYAGRHRNGARAAVKVLHPELARIAEVRERFLREGYAANRVEHRGAVQVLDDDVVEDGDDAGSAYLVMELLEGDSLDARAAREPKLGERELLEILDAVLDVLASAHANGVVHRDLKPENIFLANDPERDGVRVKVLDFGLARIVDTSNVTNNGLALGTPSFMSPEQAAGRREEIDGQTDIFALGATAFRIVTERRIHEADNMVQLVVMMATKAAPKLRDVHPASTPRFAAIVDRALAFDKKDRYPDATSMQKDVRAALEALGVRAPHAAGIAAGSPPSARERSTVQVLPYSTRNVPPQALVTAGAVPNALARAETTHANDAPPSDGALAKPVGNHDSHDSPDVPRDDEGRASEPARPARKPSTLPWLIAVASLSILAWTYGPALHRELSRHTALPPVPDLWGANATSQAGAGANAPNGNANAGAPSGTGPSGEPALSSATLDDGDASANTADAGAPLFELGADAGPLGNGGPDGGADAGDDDDDDDDDEPIDGGPLASNHAPAAVLPPGVPHPPVTAAGAAHPPAGRPPAARPKPTPGTPARHPHAPTKKHRDKWQRRHH